MKKTFFIITDELNDEVKAIQSAIETIEEHYPDAMSLLAQSNSPGSIATQLKMDLHERFYFKGGRPGPGKPTKSSPHRSYFSEDEFVSFLNHRNHDVIGSEILKGLTDEGYLEEYQLSLFDRLCEVCKMSDGFVYMLNPRNGGAYHEQLNDIKAIIAEYHLDGTTDVDNLSPDMIKSLEWLISKEDKLKGIFDLEDRIQESFNNRQ